MSRTPRVPAELTSRPFTLEEARRAGVTRSALRGKMWRRLGTELYIARDAHEDPWQLLRAWHRLLPAGTTFAGGTAAWLLGLATDALNPIEVAVPSESGVRARPGLCARRCDLSADEVGAVRGLPATMLPRTLLDLCSWRAPVEALVVIDMAIRSGLTDNLALWRHGHSVSGRPGSARLRALARVAAPAESPMETRLRWLLHEAGLPRPQVQTDLRDGTGRFLGRADLYYPASRLAIEFDGGQHRESLVADDRRQNALITAGYQVLRFTTADLRGRPQVITAQVRAALGPRARIQTRGIEPVGASEWIQTRGIEAEAAG